MRADRKTRQAWAYIGTQCMLFGLMAGEISPDMMFWAGRQKLARMGTDGYKSVRMSAVGLVGARGTRNSKKRFENASIWQYLATHDHCTKIRLTLGVQKNRTERAISIICGGQGLKNACI